MAFSGVLSTLLRNHIPKLRTASKIRSNVSHLKAALAISWRTYANNSPPHQRGVELGDANEGEDLFSEGSTNEADLTEAHLEKHNLPGLKDKNVLSEGIDEEPDTLDESRPKYISRGKLLAAHRARVIPVLKEEDLEEMFVRGSGPGGQAINKTSSSVSLIHRPTGIRVQCQATRSREQNRKIARKIMLEKLDQLANPGLSKLQVEQEKIRAKKRQRAKKAKKKAKQKSVGESMTGTGDAENSSQA